MPIDQSKLLSLLPGYDGQDAAAVAEALSEPTITTFPYTINAATLGKMLGTDETAGAPGFMAGLGAILTPNRADYFARLLYGPGMDFGDAEVREMADGIATAFPPLAPVVAQLKGLAETRTYRCDAVVTADDVAAGRVTLAAQAAAKALSDAYDALADSADNLRVAWLNDVVNPARANGTDPATLQSFKDYVGTH